MQKVSNDINVDNATPSASHAPITDAIRNGNENLINILNFSRRNLSNITIIKKDGTKEKYNIEKVVDAIRGCTADCFEECEEKGVLYGVGLNEVGDAEKKPEFMATAYQMGKNC